VERASRLLTDEIAYRTMATAKNPYGDGLATERIIARIRRHFGTVRTHTVSGIRRRPTLPLGAPL
jgi:UDP-N-acetylglucosamine 2-epimerase